MEGVPCLRCGERGSVRVSVDDGDTLACGSCNDEFSVADVRAAVEAWVPFLKWLDSHPARTAEAAART